MEGGTEGDGGREGGRRAGRGRRGGRGMKRLRGGKRQRRAAQVAARAERSRGVPGAERPPRPAASSPAGPALPGPPILGRGLRAGAGTPKLGRGAAPLPGERPARRRERRRRAAAGAAAPAWGGRARVFRERPKLSAGARVPGSPSPRRLGEVRGPGSPRRPPSAAHAAAQSRRAAAGLPSPFAGRPAGTPGSRPVARGKAPAAGLDLAD